MRNFKLLSFILLGVLCSGVVLAQTKQKPSVVRCGTMENLETYFQANPRARLQSQQNASQSGGTLRASDDSYRLNAIVTIPVVIHVVLPTPSQITDADVNYFINRLNVDYSGLNPDSTNIPAAFQPLRGHSQIRFCLAKRTPGGLVTTGIERRASGTQANINLAVDPIKRTAQGGLDAWSSQSYLNVWVGIGNGGLYGYATFPGSANAADEGVFLASNAFANNSCYTDPNFLLGRTGTHEVGHYLGLYHLWGDDGNACTGDDFRQLLAGTCLLPTGLFNPAGQGNTATDVGDTPNQGSETPFTCPTGIQTDACATTAPGRMYQNYMDYTADACYSMFTVKQAARMEWVIDNCRAGLKTSLGCTPPVGFPTVDAGINDILSPGGSEYNSATCSAVFYPTPTCPGAFTPRLSVTNFGTATITSITVTLTVGTTTITQTFTVNLISNASTTLVFPAQNLAIGTTAISFTITAVNGSPDTYMANNTASTNANVAAAIPLPFTQDFSSTTFPPPNMTIFNPNGNFTWIRAAVGNGTPGSAAIDNYNNDNPNQIDDIRTVPLTPPANPTPQDSLVISFDVAHKNYTVAPYDILSVLVSTDCGATFTSVYSKSGPTLATAGASGAAYTAPIATDWRRERIKIGGAFLTSGPIIVAFRNTNQYGNNIFIDNINISKPVDRDLSISAINNPGPNICSSTLAPQVTVTNTGNQAVSSFRVGYRINNGTVLNQTFAQALAPNASVNVTLPASTGIPQGNNTITVFTADPVAVSGTGDQQAANDTLTKAFAFTLLPLPYTQDFVTATFPPPTMTVFNPTGATTWIRNAAGNGNPGSAFINNYSANGGNQIDDLRTLPLTAPLNPSIRDSVIVSFDLAHRPYSLTNGAFFDTLKIMVSTDCGVTFTQVASWWPTSTPSLATGAVQTTPYLVPAAADWRREKISFGGSLITNNSIIIAFRNVSKLGNNIFLDNINIERTISRDIQLVSINQPSVVTCTAITPSVTVKNTGVDTITGFKVGFVVDNGTPAITTISGITLVRDATRTFNLNAVTLPTGTHTIRVYTFDPVTALGTGDQRPTNDTLTRVVQVVPIVAAPLAENFEATTFPPAGWAVNNPDGGITWQRTTTAARTGIGSAFINNYNYANAGSRDELYSPQVTYSGVDSISLGFDVAALTYNYPGSTALPLDTLEVFATNDCGATLTSIYKKWGNELQTVNDPNYPQTTEFVPNTRNQWRRETINLSAFVNRGPLQLIFRNTNNFENNIFLDNIDLTTKTLPAKLKEQGYLIYPSPVTTNFTIQHYLTPTELRSVAVYNSVGQRVFAQTFGASGASSFMQVDMSRMANGLYTVVLRYTNRTISQKIIKNR